MQDVSLLYEQIKQENDLISKAKLLHFLHKDKKERIIDIAKILGLKAAYVCHILRLNKLSDLIIDGYYSQMISISHLFVLSRLHKTEDMMQVYEKILAENLTVIKTEELVRELLFHVSSKGDKVDEHIAKNTQTALQKKYPDLKLQIKQTRIKSTIIIEQKGSLDKTTPLVKHICSLLQTG